MHEPERSAWKLVVVGCAGLVLSLALVLAAFLYVGQRMARGVEAQMANPVVSRLAAEALLHADALPAGYKASLSLSVPLLGRVAVLEQRSGSGELFLYLESSGSRPSPESEDPRFRQLLDVRGLRFEPGVIVAESELEIGALRAEVRTTRGRLRQTPEGERDVLLAQIAIECRPPERITRLGVWIGADALEPAGTPADHEAVREFLSAFRLCGLP